MEKKYSWIFFVYTVTVLFFFYFEHEAGAQTREGRWGIGLRGGGAFLSEDISEGFKGQTGPIVSGHILYGLTDILSVGLNVEWEKHGIEVAGKSVGEAKTFSLIPFMEWRTITLGNASSYLSLGLGLNVNSFDRELQKVIITDNITTAEQISSLDRLLLKKFEPDNTWAVKISGGIDYFATQNLAVNTEVGWKSNSGDVEFCGASSGCKTNNWSASVFTALVGFRFYF